MLRLDTWTFRKKKYKEPLITEGLELCTRILEGDYAGRSLSVRVTAHLYALRARLHCLRSNYILADADWGYSLCLDPFQHQVRPVAACCAGLLTSASSLMCTLLYITTHCLLLQCSLATHLATSRCAERVHPSSLRGLFVSLCTSSVYLSSGAAFEG